MSDDPSPSRVRVPIGEPAAPPDPARTGCLWAGGILGVIAGIIVVFFAVPPLLNFLFPTETVAVGQAFTGDKLTIRVAGVEAAPGEPPGYVVLLAVDARSSWSPGYHAFVLVLEDGTELVAGPLEGSAATARVPQGSSTLPLLFRGEGQALAAPNSLHLEEPAVKFELPGLKR